METFMIYLLKGSGCLSVLYLAYLLIFRKDTNFKGQRAFLLLSVALSVALPLNTLSFRSLPPQKSVDYVNVPTGSIMKEAAYTPIQTPLVNTQVHPAPEMKNNYDTFFFIKTLYLGVLFLLLSRILGGLIKLVLLLIKSEKVILCNRTVFLSNHIEGSTSILGFVFLNPGLKNNAETDKIITHENIHAAQYHSCDILMTELLAAAMWFNPVVWLMRRSLQQLHEYLADEGVLKSGINKLEYQALLINHIAEDSLVLSSGFKSSIKKRIFMMTQKQNRRNTNFKLITLIPVAWLLFLGIACVNKPKAMKNGSEFTTAIQPDTVKLDPIQADSAKLAAKVKEQKEQLSEQEAETYAHKQKAEQLSAISAEQKEKARQETNKALLEEQKVKQEAEIVAQKNYQAKLAAEVALQNETIKKQMAVTSEKARLQSQISREITPNVAVALPKMNVIYLGVENPVTIAVSNHDPSELTVAVDNGTIRKVNGNNYNFILQPKQPGKAIITVFIGNKIVSREEFRVKTIPDPVTMVANKKFGFITKDELLKAGKLEVLIENFNFDIPFKVKSFALSTTIKGFLKEEISKSEKFTKNQISLINKAESGAKIYFEDIKCFGPDGMIRNMGPLILKIK